MAAVINICFHGIGTPARELEPGEAPYWVDPEFFEEILDEVADRPDVAISFDDGNSSDLEVGLPALLRRGMTAAVFPVAGRLGRRGSLSADDLRELRRHGVAIGTHGMDHRSWRSLDKAAQNREMIEARDILADASGEVIDQAALPLGRYDRRVLGRLRSLGYRRVYTSDRASARADAWLQPRHSVRAHDTIDSLRRELLTPPSFIKVGSYMLRTAVKQLR